MPSKKYPSVKEPPAGWTRSAPYEHTHPGGWTIANRMVSGRSRWVLSCGGSQFGSFATPEDAMTRHAALGGAAKPAE